MEWREDGFVLTTRRHGESGAIVELFTRDHGRHLGIVRGGAGRRMAPILQPGAQLQATWRARLEDHLGAYTVEPLQDRAADILGEPLALAGLNALTALLSFSLPEREAHPALYDRSKALLDALEAEGWVKAYLRWELALLDELGFGLDLSQCAVTGAREGLAFISPKTGRAVTRQAAGEYIDRLLPLPDCLRPDGHESATDLALGFQVTGYFLNQHLARSLGERPLPAARQRFVDRALRQVQG